MVLFRLPEGHRGFNSCMAAPLLAVGDELGLHRLRRLSLGLIMIKDGRPVLAHRDARRVLPPELLEDVLVRQLLVEFDQDRFRVVADALVRRLEVVAARVAHEGLLDARQGVEGALRVPESAHGERADARRRRRVERARRLQRRRARREEQRDLRRNP